MEVVWIMRRTPEVHCATLAEWNRIKTADLCGRDPGSRSHCTEFRQVNLISRKHATLTHLLLRRAGDP